MSENSNKIERIENEKLVELLGSIRQDSSEENMIAVLKEAAVAKFLVPVDGSEGNYSFHAVSDSKGLKYMVVYSDSDSFEVAFEGKKEPQNGVIAGFADLIDVVMAPKMDLSGFVINPGSEQVLFGKDMLKMIAAQMVSEETEPQRLVNLTVIRRNSRKLSKDIFLSNLQFQISG